MVRFLRRQDSERVDPTEPAPLTPPPIETTTEVHNEVNADAPVEADEPAASRWLRAAISLIILVLLIIGLFLGGRWLYNTIFDNSDAPAPQVSGPGTAPGTNPAQTENGQKKDQASGSASRDSNDSQSSVASTTPTTGGELPNSGPGSVLAIFVGTSLAAAGLHYIVNLRRSA